MCRKYFLILCLMFCATGISHASTGYLSFENKTVEVTLEPAATSARIRFPFQNNTEKPIEIAKHASPCSCISASFKGDKKTYLPGEAGELEAVFKVGSFNGTISKQVVIWQKGDDEAKPSIILTANITIPELLSIEPRTLNWEAGKTAAPASYKITVNHKDPVRITGVVTTNNNFSTELKVIREGKEYEVVVSPLQTTETSFGIIKITSDSSIPRYRLTQAFAYVRQIPAAE